MEYIIGQKAEFSKTISESDVYQFAGITGDFNELHINEIVAGESIFHGRVVHGALVSALISTVLGMKLPGPGTIYMEQKSSFLKPVKIGETLTAEVEISTIDGNKATLITKVRNQDNVMVMDGEARVKLPSRN